VTASYSASRESALGGLIIRKKGPIILETPFERLDSFLTPNELFYIRGHFPAPTIDGSEYQLKIEGAGLRQHHPGRMAGQAVAHSSGLTACRPRDVARRLAGQSRQHAPQLQGPVAEAEVPAIVDSLADLKAAGEEPR
jgi:hypothetical protein